MQFAFSYFYYLIHEEMEFSLQVRRSGGGGGVAAVLPPRDGLVRLSEREEGVCLCVWFGDRYG